MRPDNKNNLLSKSERIDMEEGEKCLSKGFFQDSLLLYNAILDKNPHSKEGESGYRTTKFWLNRFDDMEKLDEKSSKLKRIIENWEQYEKYAIEHKIEKSRAYFALLSYIHRRLTYVFPHTGNIQGILGNDYKTIAKLGEIFLRFEDWTNAVHTFESARTIKKEDPYILALLGESY